MADYNEIMLQLQAPFPPNTVVVKSKRAFIPVQAYMARLEAIAKEHWGWAIVADPQIDMSNSLVTIRGELSICGTKRQGIGISAVREAGPTSIKNAILTAESEALRDACDKFLMGWRDLAPHRSDWSQNPAVQPFTNSTNQNPPNYVTGVHSVSPLRDETCVKCGNALTDQDLLTLRINNVKINYCHTHIPKQFIKS